jgi:uncharacterized membrane protein YeaQ/YmgE (transglycosylase-associated protein family)
LSAEWSTPIRERTPSKRRHPSNLHGIRPLPGDILTTADDTTARLACRPDRPGHRLGLAGDLIAGIAGAFIASWILPQLAIHLGSDIVSAIVSAAIGAVLLLLILTLVAGSNSPILCIRACGWIGSQRDEKSTQQKDCKLRVASKIKAAIAGTFIGRLYLPPVQSWTHDNW